MTLLNIWLDLTYLEYLKIRIELSKLNGTHSESVTWSSRENLKKIHETGAWHISSLSEICCLSSNMMMLQIFRTDRNTLRICHMVKQRKSKENPRNWSVPYIIVVKSLWNPLPVGAIFRTIKTLRQVAQWSKS